MRDGAKLESHGWSFVLASRLPATHSPNLIPVFVRLNREIVGMRSPEKLVSVGRDEEKYLHCRPVLADESGEFTVSFFRETAEELLGAPLRKVEALSATEQGELLDAQMGKQLKLEVQAKWYSGGSKYSFIGNMPASFSHVTSALQPPLTSFSADLVCPTHQ